MNRDKLLHTFAEALGVESVPMDLQYNTISEWDSVAHLVLIAAIESTFDVMLDTDDIIDMSSPAKAIEILSRHGVDFA